MAKESSSANVFTRAFPNVRPREQIEWLDEHARCELTDELVDATRTLNQEIKCVQLLCALMEGIHQRHYPAPLHIEFFSQSGEKQRGTCYAALEARTFHLCELFLRTWKDPASYVSLKQLKQVLGALIFMRRCRGYKPGLDEDQGEMYYEALQRAMQWATQLTGAEDPTHKPLPIDASLTPRIKWKVQMLVRAGMADRFQGRYKHARAKFARAKDEFEWIPTEDIATFLETPGEIYRDDDIETPAVSASASAATVSGSARKSVIDRISASYEQNEAQSSMHPIYAGTDPLTLVAPFRA